VRLEAEKKANNPLIDAKFEFDMKRTLKNDMVTVNNFTIAEYRYAKFVNPSGDCKTFKLEIHEVMAPDMSHDTTYVGLDLSPYAPNRSFDLTTEFDENGKITGFNIP
jgi:hypothetical protein